MNTLGYYVSWVSTRTEDGSPVTCVTFKPSTLGMNLDDLESSEINITYKGQPKHTVGDRYELAKAVR